MKVTFTPYTEVITLSTSCGGILQLDVSTKEDKSFLTISHSSCKYALIAVPSTVFSQWLADQQKPHTYVNSILEETLTIRPDGTITLDWEGLDIVVCQVLRTDLISLGEHFNNKARMYSIIKAKFNVGFASKVKRNCVKLFNLPAKILGL